jgi:hypothetical protein
MNLRDWKELVKEDFPEMGPVTAETIEAVEKNCYRFRGGMRISTGRIWRDDEFEERRRKVLSTPVP